VYHVCDVGGPGWGDGEAMAPDMLVLGAELPDPAGAVERIRQVVDPAVSLPPDCVQR
jgi:hypothetical protein